MNLLIAGGKIGIKPSSVVKKMMKYFSTHVNTIWISYNNGTLPFKNSIKNKDLLLWMPDIDNEQPKDYPVKDTGSVLICSKVMRPGYTKIDAVSRIFKMHGNAVIAIYKEQSRFRFELIDALGNSWCNTYDIDTLCEWIIKLYKWTKEAVRVSIPFGGITPPKELLKPSTNIMKKLININTTLAKRVASQSGNRHFGNYSTRCTKLFPSSRDDCSVYVSPRNIDKRFVTVNDIVPVYKGKYYGERKPSVDTPVQVEIYKQVRQINFMIHGHAYIDRNVIGNTKNYFPCGDMREVNEIVRLLKIGHFGINLKNHGFLITANSIEHLESLCKEFKFTKL